VRIACVERSIIERKGFSNVMAGCNDRVRQAERLRSSGYGSNSIVAIVYHVDSKATLGKEEGISSLSASEFENFHLVLLLE
jgi:hypothetical protein